MNRNIQLYINGHLVEWNGNPNIQFTYQTADYTNPTVIKNNFSKTLNIDGTPENNKIFNEIWNLDRVMDGAYTLFNPSQKVPFELYRDDETVEKGYAKLDSIDRDGNKVKYNITLYGGLGSFFYSLDYDINSDRQKSLSDLDFMGTNSPDDEFTFEISKNRVYEAWSRLGVSGNISAWEKWDYINFAPCYNGLPENFDTSKVLLNTNNISGMAVRWTNDEGVQYTTFPQTINANGTAFTPFNGYVYGDLNKDLTEWETRDLRSYLQRPVLSIKGLFNAIKRPQNNGGYFVDLDPDFFSSGNPYYEKAWVTLPLLDSAIETEGTSEEFLWRGDTANKVTFPRGREQTFRIVPISSVSLVPDKLEFKVEVHNTFSGATADRLYTSIRYGNGGLYGGLLIQLYINKDTNLNLHPDVTDDYPNAVCGSNRLILTSKTLDGHYWNGMQYHTSPPYTDVATEWRFGYWKKVSGDDYVWTLEDGSTTIGFTIDTDNINLIPMICYWSKSVCNFSNPNNIYDYTGMVYSAQTAISLYDAFSKSYVGLFGDYITNDGSFKVTRGGDVTRSNTTITKRTLFGGMDVTPCDWLLGYCKMFGLHIFKDKNDDTIYIRMRNNFYGDEIYDIEELVDRGNTMKITPLTFNTKWYTLNYTESEGKFLETYKKNYNQDFGKQLIDTRYNFDSEDVDLLEGIVYRNGLTALEKSNYFNNKYDAKMFQIPPVLYDWVKVKYYALEETYETNMALPQGCTVEYINKYMDGEYYDVIPKLQIHDRENNGTDGEGILVFFNGKKNTGNVKYWLTDDLDEMFRESDNPCWLATMDEWNTSYTKRIALGIQALPEFGRYVLHYAKNPIEDGIEYQNITASWDFGRTKELFVPYYKYDINKTPTIYENFWQMYINDLYSVDTRKVDTYVKLDTNSVYDALKRFYWFDNCIWVMTKVENYDICLERNTLCSFTKVNDLMSYLHDVTFDDYFFNFYRLGGNINVPWSGTTDELTVDFGVDSSSDWYVMTGDYTIANMVGAYSANAVSGTAGMGILVQALFTPNLGNEPRSVTFYGVNMETNQVIPITVTQDAWKHSSHLFLGSTIYYVPQHSTGMTFAVNVYSSDPWNCTHDVDWLHSASDSGVAGDYTIWEFTCDPNYTGSERRTEVLFSNGTDTATLLVVQADKSKGSIEQDEPESRYVIPSTGDTVMYEIKCNTNWRLLPSGSTSAYTTCADYDVEKEPTTGYTTGITVLPNNSRVSRNIFFYLLYDGNIQKPTIVQLPLVQNGIGNTVFNVSHDFKGDTITLNGVGMPWKAYTYEDWISVSPTSGGGTDRSVDYTLQANTGDYRVGYIHIEYTDEYGFPCNETFEIRQEGIGQFSISPTAITIPYTGGTYIINVTSSTPFTAYTSDSWLQIDQRLHLTAIPFETGENDNATARIGRIYVTNGVETAYTQVFQYAEATESPITIKPSSSSYGQSGGTGSFVVYCQGNWALSYGDDWVTLDTLSGNGDTIVNYTVSANSSLERSCEITGYMVDYPQYSATTVVRQDEKVSYRLLYTSTDGNIISPNDIEPTPAPKPKPIEWGANIISNTYTDGQGIIEFDSPITKIPAYAFKNSDRLETIIIPNSVTNIEEQALATCESLTSVTIPNSVTTIENMAFTNCISLTEITIPDSVTSLGHNMFNRCTSLTGVTLSNSLTKILGGTFAYCTSLTSLTIPNSVTEIMQAACTNCTSLIDVTIPDSVTTMGGSIFRNCTSLTDITIPDSVTTMGGDFQGCTSLTGVTLSNSITILGDSMFSGCTSLQSIKIPSSVTEIYRFVFDGCTNLNLIYAYPTTCPSFLGNDFVGISPTGSLYYPIGSNYASMYYRLPSATSTTSGWTDNTTDITYYSTNRQIVTPNNTSGWCDNIVFNRYSAQFNEGLIRLNGAVTEIPQNAFSGCTTLQGIIIPNSAEAIGEGAFDSCVGLISVTIPNYVKNIGDEAFANCTSLTGLTIPNSVKSIGDGAFENCSQFNFIKSNPKKCPTLGENVFHLVSNTGTLNYPSGSDYSEMMAKLPIGWIAVKNEIEYTSTDENIVSPTAASGWGSNIVSNTYTDGKGVMEFDGLVTTIPQNAFSGCTTLKSAKIPSSVTSLKNYAFSRCSSLTGVTIPSSVTSFGSAAFDRCTSLAAITIPSSVTSIGSSAFWYCTKLKTIYAYPTTCPTLGSNVLTGISSTGTLHYPRGSNYSSMISKLPSGWTAIGDL